MWERKHSCLPFSDVVSKGKKAVNTIDVGIFIAIEIKRIMVIQCFKRCCVASNSNSSGIMVTR